MKTLLPQGFSRSLLSFTSCGYLPSSRQNSLILATRHPQGCPGNLRSSLRQEDTYKSRSADCRERSTRRERARGGLSPLPSSCEVSSALVRATETVGLDRIRLILVSTRRLTSDRRRKDHSRVAFLRGESRVSLTVARSRQSPRLHEDRLHPYQAQTKTTQATEYAMYRQRCLRVTRSPELQSANGLRREPRSSCLTLVTPATLPRHGCRTRRRHAPVRAFCSFGSGSRKWDGTNAAGGAASPQISREVFRTAVAHIPRRARSPLSAFPNVRLEAQSVHNARRLTTLAPCSETNGTEKVT